jgi:hypothetical protein
LPRPEWKSLKFSLRLSLTPVHARQIPADAVFARGLSKRIAN